MRIVQGPSADASSRLSLFLSRSATLRTIWAIALVTLGFAACSDRVPDEVDEKTVQTRARISFSYPQVFSRESLINDRLKEGQFLDDLLTKSADAQFQPQLRRDLTTISAITAQLGITSNPGAKLDFERSKQLDDIKQEIEFTKLLTDLQRVQQQYASLQSDAGTASAGPSSTTTAPAVSQSIDQSAAKAQLDAVVSKAKDTLDQLSKLTNGNSRQASETQSPEDRFKDLQAYRAELRSALNTAKLDDVHDRDGNALFRMQFIATVFPGTGEAKKQWGIARVEVVPPELRRRDIERLYMRWLAHSTVRFNMIHEERITDNPQYISLVNNTNLLGLMSLSPCVYNPIKSKDIEPSYACDIPDPLQIATNPELLYDIKWLLMGRRYKRLANMLQLLKRYLAKDPTASELFINTLDKALERDQSCEFFRDPDFTDLQLWQKLPGTDLPLWQKLPGIKSQNLSENAKVRADTWQEIFQQARQVARINPFLIVGLQSAHAIQNDFHLQAQKQLVPGEQCTPENVDSNGVCLLTEAADVAADLLGVVEDLYKQKKEVCSEKLKALQKVESKVEVPCSFLRAITVPNKGGANGKEDELELCSKDSSDTPSTLPAAEVTKPPAKVMAWGKAVVYSVTPTEKAQRVSTVASAANSAQIALGLAAGLPSSGVGAQGGGNYLRSAVENADALERLPLIVAFSDQGSKRESPEGKNIGSRFGWVFGPQSYIKAFDNKNSKIGLRQMITNHQVAVEISVPVWWPTFKLEIATAWVGNAWEDPNDYLDAKKEGGKHNTQTLEVNRPLSIGDLDSLTSYLLRASPPYSIRQVLISRVEPKTIALCNDRESVVTLLIYGLNLWRNPEAYLLGKKANKIHVLPDMQGITAEFTLNRLQKAPSTKPLLVIWTRTGPVEFPMVVQNGKENCPGKSTSTEARGTAQSAPESPGK